MFTTKKKLAEQVLRRISGGDAEDDSQFDIREIILLVEQAVNALVKADLLQGLAIGETYIGTQYISTFMDTPVLFDNGLDKAYSEIPCNYLSLPDDRGVYHISRMKGQDDAFVPLRNGSETLYSHSPARNLEGRAGFWTEGKRIYYKPNIFKDGCKGVLLKLVVASPSEIKDDEPYPIGSDMELPVIEKVLEIMGVNGPVDHVNDNNP